MSPHLKPLVFLCTRFSTLTHYLNPPFFSSCCFLLSLLQIPVEMELASGEILVLPKTGQGHLFPCIHLCHHLLLRNYHVTLISTSHLSPFLPSSLLHSPLFQPVHLSPPPPPPPSSTAPPPPPHYNQMAAALESLLIRRRNQSSPRPLCAIIDHVMSKNQTVFIKFDIPTVVFITSGACWAAVQHAAWAVRPADMKPGESRHLPGLPEEMVLKYSDLHQRRHWLPPQYRTGTTRPGSRIGPPFPGEPAPWVEEVKSSAAILINTCDHLERPFLDYVTGLTQKPVYAVGPLLPVQYWQQSTDLEKIRSKGESNYSDNEIIKWLESKPLRSVTYISFGSEVGPSMEEYPELAKALEHSNRPFIWVIRRPADPVEESYFPEGLEKQVGERAMIIQGWAPQLLILRHESVGGFISHCGWNSSVEAFVGGVPIVAWPIRGDQYYNAMLVERHLKVGIMVKDGYPSDYVDECDLVNCIERILTDEGIRTRALALKAKLEDGFPKSSMASLEAFIDFIGNKNQN